MLVPPDDLIAMVTFARVVEAGSFTRAARLLEVSKSVVSTRVSFLERRLGVRLLLRSTRRLSVTFRGHLRWGGPHPVAQGAYDVDYVLDEGFGVTPLHEQATALLNQVRAPGVAEFVTGKQQDLLRKAFPLFNIAQGQVVMDYDLIYFRNGLLFMGAKHVDGTPFDRPERRPHQLQVPLVRVASAGTP